MNREADTKSFYDSYWPINVPDYRKTVKHIKQLLPDSVGSLALDAGCGTGVCSVGMADAVNKVIACDISLGSLKAASRLRRELNIKNIDFINANLLNVPFKNKKFDLVLSWGVIHHTMDPEKVISELARVLKPGGYLIVAVYLKTRLTFIHELIRHTCLRIKSPVFKKAFIKSVTYVVKILEILGKKPRVRDDNILIESLVEDWFFVPIKHFFTPKELQTIFEKNNFTFEILCGQTGRLKSSSNIIARGIKSF